MTSGWLSWVRANDVQIMSVLQNQASNLVKATSVLAELISDYSTLKEKNTLLKNLEQEGDTLTHQLFTIIDKTFITPLDKEDISDLKLKKFLNIFPLCSLLKSFSDTFGKAMSSYSYSAVTYN